VRKVKVFDFEIVTFEIFTFEIIVFEISTNSNDIPVTFVSVAINSQIFNFSVLKRFEIVNIIGDTTYGLSDLEDALLDVQHLKCIRLTGFKVQTIMIFIHLF